MHRSGEDPRTALTPDALAMLQAQGVHPAEAERRAADRVTLHQVETVALPRRFSLPMQEIWLLQSRFPLRQRKRVVRLLAYVNNDQSVSSLVINNSGTTERTCFAANKVVRCG